MPNAPRAKTKQRTLRVPAADAISPEHMRLARTLLGWSRERLGALSEVSANFIVVFEKEGRIMTNCHTALHQNQIGRVREALEAAGVLFPKHPTDLPYLASSNEHELPGLNLPAGLQGAVEDNARQAARPA